MITDYRCYFRKNYCMNNNFTIEVQNNGFFNAKVRLNYFYNGQFIADSSGVLKYRGLYRYNIPRTAYKVVINVDNLSVTPNVVMCNKTYETAKNIRILLWGSPGATNCTESNGLSNYSC